jgi:tRNA(fMet)-specific endonuclease VapC
MRPEDVPGGPIMVDTDVATWLLLAADDALRWQPLLRGHVLALSFANVGELLALPISRNWGGRRQREWAEAIRRAFVVLPVTSVVAEQWAPLHVKYRGHMQRGGANDLWVAATALASEPRLPLATNNLSDFQKVAADHPLLLVHPDLPGPNAATEVSEVPSF